MREEARRLLLQARRDLENAEKNISIAAYEVAAFLCHQGVEKYLKAAWIELQRERPPATHSLRDLGAPLGMPENLLSRLRYLNPDYTIARYPDAANGIPYEMYDQSIARSKLAAALEVAEWIESRIR
ncbi:MAG TPA: HEPN domain-containing protein [Thermoanaerobaculia bacterium]|nr:HEPN domain-containing protein [Thermoanaerobaculia bacterium]